MTKTAVDKKLSTLLIGIVLFLVSVGYVSISDDSAIIQKFSDYQHYNPQEKIYLHLDKPNYITGETIWFKVYLRNAGNLTPSAISRTVYVELIDSDQVVRDSRLIYVDSNYSAGDFELPVDMLSGIYRIRAYTNWMRNYNEDLFFEQDLRINALHTPQKVYSAVVDNYEREFQSQNRLIPEVDLQFFPEGGQLINLLSGKVAFKATDKYGKGIEVEGSLIDSQQQKKFTFKSSHNGMGIFYYLPNSADQLQAVLENVDGIDTRIELPFPEIQPTGYVMSTTKKNDETIIVHVKTNGVESLDNCYLTVAQGDLLLSSNRINTRRNHQLLKISTKDLKNGLVRLTLFDKNQRPRCERTVFNYNPSDDLVPNVQLPKAAFQKRENMEIEIDLSDKKGLLVSLEASLSITNSDLVDMDQKRHSIVSQLLLTADLKGHIENPREYFENYNSEKGELLDLVMLTNGWNRYTWQDMLNYEPVTPKYLPETAISFYGNTKGFLSEKKEVKTQVTASAFTVPLVHDSTITDKYGNFVFTSYVFFDTTDFIFQARRYSDKKAKATKARNVTVNINDFIGPEVSPRRFFPKLFSDQKTEQYRLSKYESVRIDSAYALKNRVIILDEMTVEGNRIEDERESWALHSWADREIDMDDVIAAGSMMDFIHSRPEFMRIRRFLPRTATPIDMPLDNNGVLILLDGMQILYDQLTTIMQSQIEKTEVLNAASASVYGSRARNGAIIMYSATGESGNRIIGGINYVRHPGFYNQKEFYSPKYDVPHEDHVKPDYRSTLYWEPNIQVDSTGTAKVKFFTNDKPGEYLIELEGIANGNVPFRTTKSFRIE